MPSSVSYGAKKQTIKLPGISVMETLKKPGAFLSYGGFKSNNPLQNHQQQSNNQQPQQGQTQDNGQNQDAGLVVTPFESQLNDQNQQYQDQFNKQIMDQQNAILKAQTDMQDMSNYYNNQRKSLLDDYYNRSKDYQGVLTKLYDKQSEYDKRLGELQLDLANRQTTKANFQTTDQGQAVNSTENKTRWMSLLQQAYRPISLTRSY
ncbi:MAG: hypothetical protein ACRDEA_00215 [Microcystaceae cyanobacterium]